MTGTPPAQTAQSLSSVDYHPTPGTRLYALENWNLDFVRQIRGPLASRKLLPSALWALRVLWAMDRNSVVVCNGGSLPDKLVCLFNAFLPMKRKTLLFETYPTSTRPLARWLNRKMLSRGATLVVVWSREGKRRIRKYLDIPGDNMVCLPYKCNYTKPRPGRAAHAPADPEQGPPVDFVFSGGNNGRDYQTLCEAMRGTGIPCIISTTDKEQLRKLRNVPENIIVSSIREPSYSRMIQMCRVYVVSLRSDLVRSAGEQNFLNAPYYSRPIVCADDVSAGEYVEQGVTGYVVPAGDAAALRRRIVELWEDRERAERMGARGKAALQRRFTHDHFKKRLFNLAFALNAKADAPEYLYNSQTRDSGVS
jgi:glycosyltransferase involved in cell wall biosynthesis